MKRILLTIGFFLVLHVAFAADRFWVGTLVSNNWNNTANWSTVSGGAGGATVPGPTDRAIFDVGSNNDCNIDIDVTVRGIDIRTFYSTSIYLNGHNVTVGTQNFSMAGGNFYVGTGNFTSTTNFLLSGGNFVLGTGAFSETAGTFSLTNGATFQGSSGRINIGGAFTFANGTFTASSDSTFFGGNMTINAAGTDPSPAIFNHNNGTVVFNATTNRVVDLWGANSGFLTFYDVVLAMRATSPNTLTLAANDRFDVDHAMFLNTGQLAGGSGSQINIVNSANMNVGPAFGGSGIGLFFLGTGTNNYSLDAPYSTKLNGNVSITKDNFTDSVHVRSITPGKTIVDGFFNTSLFSLQIGILDFPDNNKVNFNFTQMLIFDGSQFISTSDSLLNTGDLLTGGDVFRHNNGTFVFSGNQSRALEFPPGVPVRFYKLVLNKPAITNNLTLLNGITAEVENDFTIVNGELLGGAGPDPTGFALNGNLIGEAGMSSTVLDMNFTGTADQTITLDPAVTANLDGNIIINKPTPGNITLNSPVILDNGPNQVLTFTQGIINTTATNLLTLGDNNTVTGANNNSYVSGPMQKIGTNWFEFPVGAAGFYAPIRVTGGNGPTDDLGGASTFTAQYNKVNPDPTFPPALHDPSLTNVSFCEYWDLSKDLASPVAFVWLGYDNTRSCGVTDPTKLRVARWNGIQWADEGIGSSATVPLVSTFNAQASFGLPFTLASVDQLANSLPVTLTEFTGKEKDGDVELKWTTETEINNKYFDVERSLDGSHFESIGKVTGAGNTTLTQHYGLVDRNAANGVNYYRLKQVDFDGKFTYSQVVAVKVTRINALLKVYPNPAINQITAEYKGFANTKVQVQLIDNYGRTIINSIQQPGISGRISLQLGTAVKTAGTYWLKMTTDKETLQQKVVVGQQ